MEEKVVKMGVVGLRRGRLIKNAFGAKHFNITAVCDRAEIPLRDGVKMCEEAGYKVQGFDNYDDFIANADIRSQNNIRALIDITSDNETVAYMDYDAIPHELTLADLKVLLKEPMIFLEQF